MGNRYQRERYRQSRRRRRDEMAEAVKTLGAWWRARKDIHVIDEPAEPDVPADEPPREVQPPQ